MGAMKGCSGHLAVTICGPNIGTGLPGRGSGLYRSCYVLPRDRVILGRVKARMDRGMEGEICARMCKEVSNNVTHQFRSAHHVPNTHIKSYIKISHHKSNFMHHASTDAIPP